MCLDQSVEIRDSQGSHVAELSDGDLLPTLDKMGNDAGSDSVRELSGQLACKGPAKESMRLPQHHLNRAQKFTV